MSPFQVERHGRAGVTARLRQIEARHQPEYDRPGEALYWSESANAWLRVKREEAGYIIEFYAGCPACREG